MKDLQQKEKNFEKLLIETHDADLIAAYAHFKKELYKLFQATSDNIDAIEKGLK